MALVLVGVEIGIGLGTTSSDQSRIGELLDLHQILQQIHILSGSIFQFQIT